MEYRFCPLCGQPLSLIKIEHTMKSACTQTGCSFVHWNNPTPVAIVLVEYQNRFVVTNNAEWPEWKYSLISGFVDEREEPLETAVREVREELSLNVVQCHEITHCLYEKLNQLMLGFHAVVEGEIRLNHENRAFRLLTLEELKTWPFGIGATPIVTRWIEALSVKNTDRNISP